MKKFHLVLLFSVMGFSAIAQSSQGNAIPADFTPGSVVLADSQSLEGYIKNNLRKNGEIILLLTNGTRKKFTAGNIIAFKTSGNNYVAVNNTFFQLIEEGPKIRLLRKASNSYGVQYNGSDPIDVGTGEGSLDDYFIQSVATKKMRLIKKKDFARVFGAACADCSSLSEDIKANKIVFENIQQAVAIYNGCAN